MMSIHFIHRNLWHTEQAIKAKAAANNLGIQVVSFRYIKSMLIGG
jgi:hypothetical protein